jgi:uncharacterized membrane protein YgcG
MIICLLAFSFGAIPDKAKAQVGLSDTTVSIINRPRSSQGITFINIEEVNDFESVFTTEQSKELTSLIKKFKLANFAVVTTSSFDPHENISEYASDFMDNADYRRERLVVFALSKNKMSFKMLVGSRLQGVLTEEECREILHENMIAEFENGNFYDGIKTGIIVAMDKIKNAMGQPVKN